MKFLLGFITSTIFIAIMFIGCWLYFDFPISTNDEKQHEPKTQQIQQEQIQNEQQENVQKQTAPATIPSQEKSPKEVDESQQRKSEIQALQENDKAQDWKKEYDKINEGTDKNPYVTINGQKVDPKHVTGKDNEYE